MFRAAKNKIFRLVSVVAAFKRIFLKSEICINLHYISSYMERCITDDNQLTHTEADQTGQTK